MRSIQQKSRRTRNPIPVVAVGAAQKPVLLDARRTKTCAHCQRLIRPKTPEHDFCWDCWRFHLGSSHIAEAVRLFRDEP